MRRALACLRDYRIVWQGYCRGLLEREEPLQPRKADGTPWTTRPPHALRADNVMKPLLEGVLARQDRPDGYPDGAPEYDEKE